MGALAKVMPARIHQRFYGDRCQRVIEFETRILPARRSILDGTIKRS